MNQHGSNLSINEETSIKETKPLSGSHNEQTCPINPHLIVEPAASGAAPDNAGASSAPQGQEMASGKNERDVFLAAMEYDLPAGYVRCPEDNRIHKSEDGKESVPFCGPIRIVRYGVGPRRSRDRGHAGYSNNRGAGTRHGESRRPARRAGLGGCRR